MTWPSIANYLAAHWLEIAGTVTTVLGIWLTTRRLLICWPVVLAADFLYLAVFFRARLFSDALLQVFFVAFTLYGWWHWWRGVQADGEVRVVPLNLRGWLTGLAAGAAGRSLAGLADGAHRRGAAASRCGPHKLQPCRQLVGRAQAHRQLVALDCGRPHLHRRVSLQRFEADRSALRGPRRACRARPARMAARASRRLRSPPAQRCAAARPSCSGAIRLQQSAARGAQTRDSIRRCAA